jgi:hypothetical protein
MARELLPEELSESVEGVGAYAKVRTPSPRRPVPRLGTVNLVDHSESHYLNVLAHIPHQP